MTFKKVCSRCLVPWEGFGLYCNACRTIDAINNPKPPVYNTAPVTAPNSYDPDEVLGSFALLGGWVLIDWYFFNWFFTKVMLLVVKWCWAITGGLLWDILT